MIYLDSSAIVKLVAREVESVALRDRLAEDPERVASALAHVEVLRAVRRMTAGSHLESSHLESDVESDDEAADAPWIERARQVLARIALLRIDRPVLRRAAELSTPELRTLEAIHFATALSIGADLEAVITYDRRLGAAAQAHGLSVEAPGS